MAPYLSHRYPHISMGSHNLFCFRKILSIIFHHFAFSFLCLFYTAHIGPNLMQDVNICSHVLPRKLLNVFQRRLVVEGQRQQLSGGFYFGPYLYGT